MSSADGALWITYNGELYNFIELREELKSLGARFRTGSDTEVVLQAYAAWGPDAVKRFVGMWAFALLDLRGRRLMLSRDRFGIKPLQYYSDGEIFVFASEIKQLLTRAVRAAPAQRECRLRLPAVRGNRYRRGNVFCWYPQAPAGA